jgi:hypothetical protein
MDGYKELEIFIANELRKSYKTVALKDNDFTNTVSSSYFDT